jgi:hypothetical protein
MSASHCPCEWQSSQILRQLNTILQELKLGCTRRKDKDNQKNPQAYQGLTGAASSNAIECVLGLYPRTHSL